jgi:hypothetical protein
MIDMQADSSAHVLLLGLHGKLEHADYEKLVPQLETWLAEHGSIRCLVDMVDFHGFEARAIWDELRFDVRHAADIERCAVLGNRRWEAWMTQLSKALFRSAEVRYFNEGEREAALEWLRAGR